MAAKFQLKQTGSGQFRFNLLAANGQVILSSENYTSKSAAKNGIESVKKNAPSDERYERRTSKAGDPYFVLKAANQQVIGTSEMYSSKSAMEQGIESVKKSAPGAEVAE
ncbi:MAG: YegP family protein [Anaerolineales bacterium]|nr:YegP family protein [Anaerolineales bacterium]